MVKKNIYTNNELKRNFILKKNQDKSYINLVKSQEIIDLADNQINSSLDILNNLTKKKYTYNTILNIDSEVKNPNYEVKNVKCEKSIEEIYEQYTNEYGYEEVGLEDILTSEEFDIADERLEEIELEFSKLTKLNSVDMKFLMLATALQTTKSLTFPYVAKKYGYGEYINKEDRLDHDDVSIKKEQKESKDKFRDKHQQNHENGNWINMIYQTPPYDITKGSADLGINMGGRYHRQPTLGHDPILGFIFGTANILTDTITFTNFSTNIVERAPKMKITNKTLNLYELANKSYDVIKEDYFNLPAALFAQYMHLKSDINTKLGLPVPIISIINNNYSSELYRKGYDALCFKRDVGIVGVSFSVSQFIDMIIGILHSFYRQDNEDIGLYEVKTRKILLYSNLIATTSSVIATVILKNPKIFDIGSGISTLTRLFTDIRFILRIKQEFISMRIEEELQEELDKIDSLLNKL